MKRYLIHFDDSGGWVTFDPEAVCFVDGDGYERLVEGERTRDVDAESADLRGLLNRALVELKLTSPEASITQDLQEFLDLLR